MRNTGYKDIISVTFPHLEKLKNNPIAIEFQLTIHYIKFICIVS